MGLKKSGMKKGNSRHQDSRLFGIVRRVTSKYQRDAARVAFAASLNAQTRRLELASVLKAECCKAQAIRVIRQMPIR